MGAGEAGAAGAWGSDAGDAGDDGAADAGASGVGGDSGADGAAEAGAPPSAVSAGRSCRDVTIRVRSHGGRRRPPAAYSVFTAWPPNSLRSAASTLPAYVSSWRERNRVSSDSVMTGAGTSLSIASWTVQRPSPESDT